MVQQSVSKPKEEGEDLMNVHIINLGGLCLGSTAATGWVGFIHPTFVFRSVKYTYFSLKLGLKTAFYEQYVVWKRV